MDVAATGELLVRGQAEGLGHALVPGRADRSGFDGNGRSTQRGHLGSCPPGRRGGGRPALDQLAVQVTQGLARPRIGFQLLLLQFDVQVRPGGLSRHLQHGSRHRLGTPRPRFDKQEFLFNAYAARTHRPSLPVDRYSIRLARDRMLREAGFAPPAVPHLMPRTPRSPSSAAAPARSPPTRPANGIDGTSLLLQRHRWNIVAVCRGERGGPGPPGRGWRGACG